ncbi:hypothetical protein A3B32_00350 [Candidatus Uhrbacteria bacterium RIFCSPLOWO2_01_FULL_53_9]|uniref:Uncharacterized protein n=3 Tax=Candidatus Uhriibacteriota TaxID=1752732 RepID=A0A1F7UXB1_9BACT|nr:MAG: hypothetical protein A3C17_03620 [Candidatus Uhrbacteria bacterium RIFCSPHIGHO2_02_FULL_53_13]OGL82915.1 MAG: hypothetical protein A3B32_00350 [Candidatus Uhrbacteria bacterium RIFCSPLOWO2_01_FULL_53_9]OGL88971.1 MAG: hypothetical protein A3I45_03375 [Candidatus Uhrbacteria bacterium RIFCSPLOWO2_02_FULL_53_10]
MPTLSSPNAATTLAEKQILTPEQTGAAPLSHSHTTFMVAIIAAAIVAVAAFVLMYLSWRQGSSLQERLTQTQQQNAQLTSKAAELQEALDNTPEPIPFFYARAESGTGTHLVEVDPKTGDERTVFTLPESLGGFDALAVPRVGFDGRVFLTWIPTSYDWLAPNVYPFNVKTDSELIKASFSDDLPKDQQAVAISPDETMIAAVYSEGLNNDKFSDALVVWNLLTGEPTSLLTIDPSESFAGYEALIDDIPMQSGFTLRWVSRDCVFTQAHLVDEETNARSQASGYTRCVE